MADARELGDIVAKVGTEAADILSRRVVASLDEVKAAARPKAAVLDEVKATAQPKAAGRVAIVADTRVVRNLGAIWNRHGKSRGIRGSFLVFQAPEEACLELCWSPYFVRPGMLWTASLAIRSVASKILISA